MWSILFYGGIVLAIIGASVALRTGSWKWMLASVIGWLPMVLYLSAAPRFTGYFLVLIFPVVAIWGLVKRRKSVAAASVIAMQVSVIVPFVMIFVL